ncbi:MAG TPA: hypothetical protein VFH39_03890 [Candidatus Saccharimonadales bacterium]|nr:hypothetical protein [Candidatus Saccharimonadales bacterium]
MRENGGESNHSAQPAQPAGRHPVMDVVRRPVDPPATRAEIAPPPDVMKQIEAGGDVPPDMPHQPAMDVVKEPPREDDTEPTPHPEPVHKPESHAPAPKPVKPAQASTGVTGAIVATVVIVLVLSGLAVFAYLQSK